MCLLHQRWTFKKRLLKMSPIGTSVLNIHCLKVPQSSFYQMTLHSWNMIGLWQNSKCSFTAFVVYQLVPIWLQNNFCYHPILTLSRFHAICWQEIMESTSKEFAPLFSLASILPLLHLQFCIRTWWYLENRTDRFVIERYLFSVSATCFFLVFSWKDWIAGSFLVTCLLTFVVPLLSLWFNPKVGEILRAIFSGRFYEPLLHWLRWRIPKNAY